MTVSGAVSHKQVFPVPVSIILLAFIVVCAEQWHLLELHLNAS